MPSRFCSIVRGLERAEERGQPGAGVRGAGVLHLAVGRCRQALGDHNRDHIVQPDGLGIGAQPHQPALRRSRSSPASALPPPAAPAPARYRCAAPPQEGLACLGNPDFFLFRRRSRATAQQAAQAPCRSIPNPSLMAAPPPENCPAWRRAPRHAPLCRQSSSAHRGAIRSPPVPVRPRPDAPRRPPSFPQRSGGLRHE